MSSGKVVIIGAGIGGLAAAALLSARSIDVTVIERQDGAGGKARCLFPADRPVDAGPTVFTMRWVFDELFDACGGDFGQAVSLDKLAVLARHDWDGERLDLFADLDASIDSIGTFAGAAEAKGYSAFCKAAAQTYRTLEGPFLRGPKTNPLGLTWRIGLSRLADMTSIRPFVHYWRTLQRYFTDPRLQQLFGRYATYNGSSPFRAPSTLMLIAHVEQQGVWTVKGGLQGVAQAIAGLAHSQGATFRYRQTCRSIEVSHGKVTGLILDNGERIEADCVVFNGDPSAFAARSLGNAVSRAVAPLRAEDRSLSAYVWTGDVAASGFPLERHNVVFSSDYRREFDEIERHGHAADPTVYVCAQDRPGVAGERERLQIIVNAAATRTATPKEIAQCEESMFARLERSGLMLDRDPERWLLTTPQDFAALYPGSGGALYGRATHGWAAAFRRPGARTAIPGLYLAGGATHPGAGVPMAALSGFRAAESVLADWPWTRG